MYEYILSQPHSKFVAPVSPLSTSSSPLLLGAGEEFMQTDVDLSSTVLRNGESPFLISTRTSSSYSSSPLHGNRDERSGRQGPVDSTYDWQFNQVLTLRRMYK